MKGEGETCREEDGGVMKESPVVCESGEGSEEPCHVLAASQHSSDLAPRRAHSRRRGDGAARRRRM